MRTISMAIAIALVLAGCHRESAVLSLGGALGEGGVNTSAVRQSSFSTQSTLAGHADRGTLFSYDQQAPVRVGASIRRGIRVSEAHALRAIAEGGMTIQAPDGRPIRLEYARRVEHKDGNWTFIGHPANAKPGEQAVITFGEKAVFGLIPDGRGEVLELTTFGGRAWLVETDPGKAQASTSTVVGADYISAVMAGATPERRLSAQSASAAKASLATSSSIESAMPTAANTIDVVLGYTATFATRLGGDAEAVTRLTSMVDTANAALEASLVNAQFRLVDTVRVEYPDDTSNRNTLFELTGVSCTSAAGGQLPDGGVSCTPATRPAALQPLADARDEFGADLVGLVRTFQSPENGSCGIGWLIGNGQSTITAADADFGFAVISDTSGNTFPDPEGGTCRNDNLAHEFGHTLGLQHDRDVAQGSDDTNGDGNLLDPEEYGRFPYAFGYVASPEAGNFFDVMAVRRTGLTGRLIYSTPDVDCGGFPCGVADQADAARALRQTVAQVAAFRATIVPLPTRLANDFNGDGISDILWRNGSTGANQVWLGANNASQLAVATVSNLAWRIVGTGDFNGDGVSDILWRNSNTGAGTIYLSANVATQQAVTTVSNLQWSVVGVGDFDGDGRADILWRNGSTGANTIWLGGSNATQISVATVSNLAWRVAGVGDFDGDGISDILWRNSTTGANLVWHSGSVSSQQTLAPVSNMAWSVVGVADFDGDGVSDILWRNSATGANTIWRSGNNATQSPVATVSNQAWKVVRTGDYDGDGQADILWRNSSTGQNLIWLSGNVGAQVTLTTVSNQSWIVSG